MNPWNRSRFFASVVNTDTRRLASWTGSGWSSTSFTSEKIVVFAPTPRPREATAASVKRVLFTPSRAAARTSDTPWRTGRSRSSRATTRRRNSRIGGPLQAVHRGDEDAPAVLLAGQHLAPGVGETVVAAAPVARPLHPAPGRPAALLQAI